MIGENELNLLYNITEKNNGTVFECTADNDDVKKICKCLIYTDRSHKIWTISSWFTKNGYGNHGIGKETMYNTLKHIYDKFGYPNEIKYIWNGTNEYVMDWLAENFDAVCDCPIAVQKTQSDDDWLSHMYTLNTKKVLKYFKCI